MVHDGEEDVIVYEAPFGIREMSNDETAIAQVMVKAAEYGRGQGCEEAECALRDALQDAYMAIIMKQAVETGENISSEVQSWHEI